MNRNRLLRFTATGLMAMGVVAGSLELGSTNTPVAIAAPPPAPYYADDELPAYPNALEFPLGESLAFNGISMRLSHFSTDDRVEKVRDFYLDRFARDGVPSQLITTSDGGYSVTGVVAGGRSKAVVLMIPRGNRTEVFPSLLPMAAEPGQSDIPEADLPYSSGAVGITSVAERAGAAGQTVTYHEPLMTLGEVRIHIREEMARRGWDPVNDPVTAANRSLVHMQKDGRSVQFSIAPYEFEPKGAVVVAQFNGGQP
ncbi:MAG: hypothetical protein ACK4N5_11855 [Myxococcales bacterium]